jgi:hypothetical protein
LRMTDINGGNLTANGLPIAAGKQKFKFIL